MVCILVGGVHTSWIGHIVRVDDREIHWVRGVDVDTAVAEWVLEGSCDANITVSIAVHEEELDLTCRSVEDLRCRVTNCFVAGDHAIVVSCVRCILID